MATAVFASDPLVGDVTSPRRVTRLESEANGDTRPLTCQLEEVVETWALAQYELVTLSAEFADSPEWVLTGSPTAAH